MGTRRLERVGQLVQAELARLLLSGVRDARLREVAISAVRMSADLRHARVYFRTLGDPAQQDGLQAALEKAAPFLRGEVGRALGMRTVPDFIFAYDETPDAARRIERLLQDVIPPGPSATTEDDEGDGE